MALLDVVDLRTHFFTAEGVVRAVDGVSFSLERGEVLGLVGESGSGKSVTGLSILGLVPDPPGRIVGGAIRFGGEDLVTAGAARLRALRGDRIALVFQDPMTALNPYLRIGVQLAEVLELHRGLTRREARRRAVTWLERVGMPDPARRLDDYPHQLSGGMRQRVLLAMALLCEPELLIADEPTTALDVTLQAQILDLLRAMKEELGLAVLLITHDLGVVAGMADRVAVMYAGRLVEQGPLDAIFSRSRHPYTAGLKGSLPHLEGGRAGPLVPIPGAPPSLASLPPGCAFHPRCPRRMDVCRESAPPERNAALDHTYRCHLEEGDT